MHERRFILSFLIVIIAHVTIPAATTNVFAQIYELPRSKATDGDFFGTAVAISGSRILVGATGEDTCGVDSGAAYIYERNGSEWEQAAILVPSDCDAGRFFGRSVALSGEVAVVAATQEFFSRENPNAVYVFEPDTTGVWRQTARLTGESAADEGPFGTSTSVHDGRILVTTSGNPYGGRRSGAAYVFTKANDESWQQSRRLSTSSTQYGVFGTSGAIHGDHAVVSASTYFRYRPGSVYFFTLDADGERWVQTARHGGMDDFFISVDIDGNRAIVGESKAGRNDTGAATLFELNSAGTWSRAATLRLNNPYDHGAFGTDVAIEGDYALIVAYDEQLGLDFNVDRVVYVFKRSATGTWREHQVIDVGEVAFGASIDLDGGYAVIGSAADAQPGAVYVARLVDY